MSMRGMLAEPRDLLQCFDSCLTADLPHMRSARVQGAERHINSSLDCPRTWMLRSWQLGDRIWKNQAAG